MFVVLCIFTGGVGSGTLLAVGEGLPQPIFILPDGIEFSNEVSIDYVIYVMDGDAACFIPP